MKKKAKPMRKRIRGGEVPTPSNPCLTAPKPARPTYADVERARERSPVEQAANSVAELATRVTGLRNDIDRHEGYVRGFKVELAAAMLEHQAQATTLRDLTAIPQPVS